MEKGPWTSCNRVELFAFPNSGDKVAWAVDRTSGIGNHLSRTDERQKNLLSESRLWKVVQRAHWLHWYYVPASYVLIVERTNNRCLVAYLEFHVGKRTILSCVAVTGKCTWFPSKFSSTSYSFYPGQATQSSQVSWRKSPGLFFTIFHGTLLGIAMSILSGLRSLFLFHSPTTPRPPPTAFGS